MVTVVRYEDSKKEIWDAFNRNSKNSLFMFDRDYMDYHRHRIKDHSLLFFEENDLIAILPMNEKDKDLISHGGLTYGGMISGIKMGQRKMMECFAALVVHAKENGFESITYKTIPYVYHKQPAEEDRFALYYLGGRIKTIDVSTVINLQEPLKMPKGRKAQISRAKREGVIIRELTELVDYKRFMLLEEDVLNNKHNVSAAHSADEIFLLHTRFPEKIRLFGSILNEELIGGTIIYEYDDVIHTQYMVANDMGRVVGALDLAIKHVMDTYRDSKSWIDFGISTEHDRLYLNEGLVFQKESFGGRTVVYEIWELPIE